MKDFHFGTVLVVFVTFVTIPNVVVATSDDFVVRNSGRDVRAVRANSGSCGDKCSWRYFSDNYTLIINGSGSMNNYDYPSSYGPPPPWYDFYVSTLVLGEGITSIGDYAFLSVDGLTDVVIPSSVSSIGQNSFYHCPVLTSVSIPETVSSIGPQAFYQCSYLKSINIPSKLTSLRYGTFRGCSNLTSVTIPPNVLSTEDNVFFDCISLKTANISANLTSIGAGVFTGCVQLTSIIVDENNKYLKSIDGILFDSSGSKIIQYPCGKSTTYDIPNSVTVIGSHAFARCLNLKSVTIPSTVTKIEDHTFFYDSSLESMTIPASVTSLGECAFDSCTNLKSVTILSNITSIPLNSFQNCKKLVSINISSTVTLIDKFAFSGCTSLVSITIPSGVTTIKSRVFQKCSNLTSLEIPASVTQIGEGAISFCSSLENITYLGTTDPSASSSVIIASNALKYICVPIDYNDNSSLFCGRNVSYIKLPSFNNLRKQHNQCFEAIICDESTGYIHERYNATEWTSQTNECAEYSCANDTGRVLRNKCFSSGGRSRVCMNGKCMYENNLYEDEYSTVEIKLEGINAIEYTVNDILDILGNVSGISKNSMNISTEINEAGEIVRLFVKMEDERDSVTLVEEMKKIDKGEGCNYDKILCRSLTPRILPKYLFLSASSKCQQTLIFIFLMTMVFFLLVR